MSAQVPSDTARLETFADGVFAIAITLLILEIRLPAPEPHGETHLFSRLASLWPSYLGYAVSFIIIGIGWINHHNFLKLIDHTDHTFMVLNLLLLLCVAFVPFPTRVLAEHLTSVNDKVAATAILWRVSHSHRRDVQPSLAIRNGRETPVATHCERLGNKRHQQALQSGTPGVFGRHGPCVCQRATESGTHHWTGSTVPAAVPSSICGAVAKRFQGGAPC